MLLFTSSIFFKLLCISDGVLFDVRSGKELHKFDKLNQTLSGVFHPNGLEVVANTEVWDLRTFHLLRTVPALDQSVLTFSPQHVIYGRALLAKLESGKSGNESKFSAFKTLDSYDYSSIATFDVKKSICDLSVNTFGSHIALVEHSAITDLTQETVVRIYGVGGGGKNVDGVSLHRFLLQEEPCEIITNCYLGRRQQRHAGHNRQFRL